MKQSRTPAGKMCAKKQGIYEKIKKNIFYDKPKENAKYLDKYFLSDFSEIGGADE